MVRRLFALLLFAAVALNGPVAMAGAPSAMSAALAMLAGPDEPMKDCGAPIGERPCLVGCVICHAIPVAPPQTNILRVTFAKPVLAPPRPLVGLNLVPETPPPRG